MSLPFLPIAPSFWANENNRIKKWINPKVHKTFSFPLSLFFFLSRYIGVYSLLTWSTDDKMDKFELFVNNSSFGPSSLEFVGTDFDVKTMAEFSNGDGDDDDDVDDDDNDNASINDEVDDDEDDDSEDDKYEDDEDNDASNDKFGSGDLDDEFRTKVFMFSFVFSIIDVNAGNT